MEKSATIRFSERPDSLYLCWHGRGRLGYEDVLALFQRLSRANMHMLVDFRFAELHLDILDAHALAARLAETTPCIGKWIAVVVDRDQLGKETAESFFELCSVNRGLTVQLFSAFDAARRWLMGTTDVSHAGARSSSS